MAIHILLFRIEHPPTGRYIETETSAPGLQFYTSKFLRDVTGKGNRQYKPFMAFCLEAQDYPNAINHVSARIFNPLYSDGLSHTY